MAQKGFFGRLFSVFIKISQQMDLLAYKLDVSFKGSSYYSTQEGRLCSLVIYGFFIHYVLTNFFSPWPIQYTSNTQNTYTETNPSKFELHISPQNKFMFAVGLSDINLASSRRYFDISFRQVSATQAGSNKSKNDIPLLPCQISQWQGINQAITSQYQQLNFNQWLCPPNDSNITLEGKYTSDTFQYAQIVVQKCNPNNTFYPGGQCYSQAEIDSFLKLHGRFTFNFYYTNPQIKLNESNYLTHYLQDKNFFYFNPDTGVSADLFFKQIQLTSQQKVFPFGNKKIIVTGTNTNTRATHQPYQVLKDSSQIVKFHLRNSYQKTVNEITYKKTADQHLAYLGGLLVVILISCSFLKSYAKHSYQIEAADTMFRPDRDDGSNPGSKGLTSSKATSFDPQSFNLLQFIKDLFPWVTSKYKECRKMYSKSIDFDLLRQKIRLFENSLDILLTQKQRALLGLVQKPTIEEAKKLRRALMRNRGSLVLDRKGGSVHIEDEERSQKMKYNLNDIAKISQKKSKNIDTNIKPIDEDTFKNNEIILRQVHGSHTLLKQNHQKKKSPDKLLSEGSRDSNEDCCFKKYIDRNLINKIMKNTIRPGTRQLIQAFLHEEADSQDTEEEFKQLIVSGKEAPKCQLIEIRRFRTEEGEEVEEESRGHLPGRESFS